MNVLRFSELTNAFSNAESGMTAQENADKITSIMLDASHGIYEEYSKDETNKIIRNLFNKISGFDFKTASPMQRRQDWREGGVDILSNILKIKLKEREAKTSLLYRVKRRRKIIY